MDVKEVLNIHNFELGTDEYHEWALNYDSNQNEFTDPTQANREAEKRIEQALTLAVRMAINMTLSLIYVI